MAATIHPFEEKAVRSVIEDVFQILRGQRKDPDGQTDNQDWIAARIIGKRLYAAGYRRVAPGRAS